MTEDVKTKKKTNNTVSIIVPTYNRPNLLIRTLQSIASQSYKDYEIVVVNDGGTDVKPIVDKWEKDMGKKPIYVVLDENTGVSNARNVGLEHSTGNYLMFLDDDDILMPHALQLRVYMLKKLKAEIVYTGALRDTLEKGVDSEGTVTFERIKNKELYWDSMYNRDLILLQNIAPVCCVLFTRKAWNKSGNYKFDTELETGEDYDFWIALSRKTDFYELKFIDAECSVRIGDPTQATGNKDFAKSYPIIYKRWRDTAESKEDVIKYQNAVLESMKLNPEDYDL